MAKRSSVLLIGLMLAVIPTTQAKKETPGPWEIAARSAYKDDYRYAAFLTDAYGLAAVGCCQGQIRRTGDRGATWNDVNLPVTPTGLDLVDEKIAWAGGESGIARSMDGGRSWQEVQYPAGVNFEYLRFLDGETGWAASPYKLFATADAGQSWKAIKLPKQGVEIAALDLIAPGEGFLLDSGGQLYVTADGGRTWLDRNLGLKGERLFVLGSPVAAMRFADREHGLVVACRPSVSGRTTAFFTADGGRSWREELVLAGGRIPRLYLARDGSTLTLTEGPKITVLRRRPQ